jgi:hypothetical protein
MHSSLMMASRPKCVPAVHNIRSDGKSATRLYDFLFYPTLVQRPSHRELKYGAAHCAISWNLLSLSLH